jgi:DNA-binding response OmpR family regulator
MAPSPEAQADLTEIRVLVVEDDRRLGAALARGLSAEGYVVDHVLRGDAALERLDEVAYEVVVLDVLLPGIGGQEVCRRLRAREQWMPVLMLTALDEVASRIDGLDSGADDYLVKPFDFGELLARLRALVRRGPGARPVALVAGPLRADPLTRQVQLGESAVELTPREFALLAHLMRHRGEVVSRAELIEQVWTAEPPVSDNVLDVYIGYLRRKLPWGGREGLIHTARGHGFMLDAG